MKHLARETPHFTWIDVSAPSAEELQAVAAAGLGRDARVLPRDLPVVSKEGLALT